jgi:hypothetical protein
VWDCPQAGRLPAGSLDPYEVLCDLHRGVGDRDEMWVVSMARGADACNSVRRSTRIVGCHVRHAARIAFRLEPMPRACLTRRPTRCIFRRHFAATALLLALITLRQCDGNKRGRSVTLNGSAILNPDRMTDQ